MLSAMFSFHGRIGRMQYFLRCMALGAAIGVVVVIGCVSLIGGGGLEALRSGQAPVAGSLVLIALPAALWSSFSLQARRFRDIGWNPLIVMSAWIVLDLIDFMVAKAAPALAAGSEHRGTMIGPLVGLVLSGSLLFWPGKGGGGDETYAPPPLEPRDPVDRFRANPTPTPAPVRDPTPARAMAPVQAAAPVTGFGRRGL